MSLFGLYEKRSFENPAVPLTSATLLDWFGAQRSDAGIQVSERLSLTMSGVYRCASLISSVCAALPLFVYKTGTLAKAPSALLDNPHPELTPYELWRIAYLHRCLWGNAYLQKVRDSVGRVQELWPIHPERVQVGLAHPNDVNPSGKVFKVLDGAGVPHPMTSREVLHIPGLGYDGITGVSPVRMASQAIGLSLAAEKYGAKLFGSGNLLSGILQTEQRLNQDQAQALQSRWTTMISGMDRAHSTAVLDSGAKFQSLTMPNDDAEMLATRQFQIPEIGRFFGVPPFLLMDTEKSTSWGTGLEQQAQGWVTFDLHPTWLAPTEQRITKELTPGGVYASYSVDGLLRGDSQARANYYQTMRTIGVLNVDEIRERENMPPLPGSAGEDYSQPLNGPMAGGGVPISGDKPEPKPDAQQALPVNGHGRVGVGR